MTDHVCVRVQGRPSLKERVWRPGSEYYPLHISDVMHSSVFRNTEMLLCKRHPLIRAFKIGMVLFYKFQAGQEACIVGYLYIEARPCVEFENKRPQILVQDNIYSEISKPGKLVAARRYGQQALPVGDGESCKKVPRIRVLADNFVLHDSCKGQPRGEVNSDADCPLVKICFAIGYACGETDHGHHWHTQKNDDPYVRVLPET